MGHGRRANQRIHGFHSPSRALAPYQQTSTGISDLLLDRKYSPSKPRPDIPRKPVLQNGSLLAGWHQLDTCPKFENGDRAQEKAPLILLVEPLQNTRLSLRFD